MAVTERDRLPESELARRFRQHALADVDYLKSRGYNPTRFLGMIAQNKSVVTVAKILFANPRLTSEGFERLWEMGEAEPQRRVRRQPALVQGTFHRRRT